VVARACGQRFVAIFTETVDWADGQDPQEWSVLPLTSDEVSRLMAMDPASVEASLYTFGMGRRSFLWRNPKGGPETAEWSYGATVGVHD
jgi:hypothetical protein